MTTAQILMLFPFFLLNYLVLALLVLLFGGVYFYFSALGTEPEMIFLVILLNRSNPSDIICIVKVSKMDVRNQLNPDFVYRNAKYTEVPFTWSSTWSLLKLLSTSGSQIISLLVFLWVSPPFVENLGWIHIQLLGRSNGTWKFCNNIVRTKKSVTTDSLRINLA